MQCHRESTFKYYSRFDVRKSVRHQTIQINQPTRCNIFTCLLLDVYVWLNMFRAPLRPSSGAYNCISSLWFYRWSVVIAVLETTTNNAVTTNVPTVKPVKPEVVNPLNAELNPICHLLALLVHHFLHVSRIRVKSLTVRLLMSYIYIWSIYSRCF